MLPEKNVICPATGFSKSCRQIYINTECGCPKYICLKGVDPNTGEPIDKWGCADTFIPILLIENSQQQRQTAAAIESFRNAMVKVNLETTNFLLGGNNEIDQKFLQQN